LPNVAPPARVCVVLLFQTTASTVSFRTRVFEPLLFFFFFYGGCVFFDEWGFCPLPITPDLKVLRNNDRRSPHSFPFIFDFCLHMLGVFLVCVSLIWSPPRCGCSSPFQRLYENSFPFAYAPSFPPLVPSPLLV